MCTPNSKPDIWDGHFLAIDCWADLAYERDIAPFEQNDWTLTPNGALVVVRKGSPLACWLILKGLISK